MAMPSREEAWTLLNEYTKNPNLIKHALAVEASMRAYAEKFGEDPERWGIVGLLHDFDYDRFPEEHPMKGRPGTDEGVRLLLAADGSDRAVARQHPRLVGQGVQLLPDRALQDVERAAAQLDRCEVITFPGAGHTLHRERATEYGETLLAFVAE